MSGINAFIAQNAANLPVEFKLTGITPSLWKADEILNRARVNVARAWLFRRMTLGLTEVQGE